LIDSQFSTLSNSCKNDYLCNLMTTGFIYDVMAMATMNRINISLIFLIMIFMVLPASAIMYASGSTDDNSEGTSDSGSTDDNADSPPSDFLPPNVDSSSSDGSTDDSSAGSSATPTENNPTLPSETPLSNNTGIVQQPSGVFDTEILAIHNQERAAVGVPPLTWNDLIAADAQEYANYLLATGKFEHQGTGTSTEWGAKSHGANENLAHIYRSNPDTTPADLAKIAQGWVNEKKAFNGEMDLYVNGHYTQMIWKSTTELGCATATGLEENGYYRDVLVCRYLPSGNNGPDPFK
jgi:uncharacterized protein YkwD